MAHKRSIFDPDQRGNLYFVIGLFAAFVAIGLFSMFSGGGEVVPKSAENGKKVEAQQREVEEDVLPAGASEDEMATAVEKMLSESAYTFAGNEAGGSGSESGKAVTGAASGVKAPSARKAAVDDAAVKALMRARPELFRLPALYEVEIFSGEETGRAAADMRRGLSYRELSRLYGKKIAEQRLTAAEMSPAMRKALRGAAVGSVVTLSEGGKDVAVRLRLRDPPRAMTVEVARDLVQVALADGKADGIR